MRASLIIFFAGLVTAQSALAETTVYVCKMTKQDSHGWIASEYAFQIDPDSRTAKVAHTPEWIDARFKDRGAKGYRMSWNRTAETVEGPNLRVRYQANFDPKDKSVKVRMAFVSVNAANKPYGVGTCAIEN